MKKRFGTDGVRGEANVVLTPTLAYEIGAALSLILADAMEHKEEKPTILIGRDTRISGTMLEGALVAGICAYGGNAVTLRDYSYACRFFFGQRTECLCRGGHFRIP